MLAKTFTYLSLILMLIGIVALCISGNNSYDGYEAFKVICYGAISFVIVSLFLKRPDNI